MKTILLQESNQEQRKDLKFPVVNYQLRRLPNSRNPAYIMMGWLTPVVDGGTTLAASLDTCRERLIGLFRDWVVPERTTSVVECTRGPNGFLEHKTVEKVNPDWRKSQVVFTDKKVRFGLFTKGLYPRSAEARETNEALREELTGNMRKAQGTLRLLDDKAGWSKTQVYILDSRPCLRGGHVMGYMVEGDAMWGDNPALLSLYMLVARFMLRAGSCVSYKDSRDIEKLGSKLAQRRAEYNNVPYWERVERRFGYALSDVSMISDTCWSWEKLLANYKDIRGKRTRKDFFKRHLGGGMIVDGIHALANDRGRDHDLRAAFAKHVGPNPNKPKMPRAATRASTWYTYSGSSATYG